MYKSPIPFFSTAISIFKLNELTQTFQDLVNNCKDEVCHAFLHQNPLFFSYLCSETALHCIQFPKETSLLNFISLIKQQMHLTYQVFWENPCLKNYLHDINNEYVPDTNKHDNTLQLLKEVIISNEGNLSHFIKNYIDNINNFALLNDAYIFLYGFAAHISPTYNLQPVLAYLHTRLNTLKNPSTMTLKLSEDVNHDQKRIKKMTGPIVVRGPRIKNKISYSALPHLNDPKTFTYTLQTFKNHLPKKDEGSKKMAFSMLKVNLILRDWYCSQKVNVGTELFPLYRTITKAELISDFILALKCSMGDLANLIWNNNPCISLYCLNKIHDSEYPASIDIQPLSKQKAILYFFQASILFSSDILQEWWTANPCIEEYINDSDALNNVLLSLKSLFIKLNDPTDLLLSTIINKITNLSLLKRLSLELNNLMTLSTRREYTLMLTRRISHISSQSTTLTPHCISLFPQKREMPDEVKATNERPHKKYKKLLCNAN